MAQSARHTLIKSIFTYIAVIILTFLCHVAKAQEWDAGNNGTSRQFVARDSVDVSLITCGSGNDLYARFGHTALRVHNYTLQQDIVLNYGCFNYNEDWFVMKFVVGMTDYLLEAEPYSHFIYRYECMGNCVKEQVLNLTYEEKVKLLSILSENLKPENQQYRYVWLYDNCTVRARKAIDKAIDGKAHYQLEENVKYDIHNLTIRDIIRMSVSDSPWVSFGLDMILGQEIDQKGDPLTLMSMPPLLFKGFNDSYIQDADGRKRPYISSTTTILPDRRPAEATTPLYLAPIGVFTILLLGLMALSQIEFKKKVQWWWLDVIVHSIQGIVGILITFLFFFSSHPGVDSNWLVIIFNPLAIAYAVWICRCHKRGQRNKLAYANMAVTMAFIATMIFCKQRFDLAMYLAIGILLLRAGVQGHFAYHGGKDKAAKKR